MPVILQVRLVRVCSLQDEKGQKIKALPVCKKKKKKKFNFKPSYLLVTTSKQNLFNYLVGAVE